MKNSSLTARQGHPGASQLLWSQAPGAGVPPERGGTARPCKSTCRDTALGNGVMLAQAMPAGNSGESPLMVSPAVCKALTAFPSGQWKAPR